MERNITVSGLIMLAPSFLQNVHIYELSAQKKEIQVWILGFRKWQIVMTLGETSLSKSRTEIKMDQSQNAGYGNLCTYDEWKVHEKYTVNNSDKKTQPRKKNDQELLMLQSRIKAENVLLDITITVSPLTIKRISIKTKI